MFDETGQAIEEAGPSMPAVVLGPGDIAQAHALDEWVALEQLDAARTLYEKVIRNDG